MTENKPEHFLIGVADNMLDNNPTERVRATAELLHAIAAAWDKQPPALRRQAIAVASAYTRAGWR